MKNFNFLTIAGSDSGGGAGIQADIKTATMLNGYATSVITALTAQNTCCVNGIFPISDEFVAAQMTTILSDININVIKSGMIFNASLMKIIADLIPPEMPYILDPVMVSKSNDLLLQNDAIDAMKINLFHKALLVTPNLPELETLSGGTTINHARQLIQNYGCQFVLIKGGHDKGSIATDILVSKDCISYFSLPRIQTQAGHGTGCTLSSAIACFIAQGLPINDAVDRAKHYVYDALKNALPIGQGHYPLRHNYTLYNPFDKR